MPTTAPAEVYPSTSGCSAPSLPTSRYGHTTFLTAGADSVIATSGGCTSPNYLASCLVLNPNNRRWDDSRMGNLTMERNYAASASLKYVGVYIFGGSRSNNPQSSDYLAVGSMQWQEGPSPPLSMSHPCAVQSPSPPPASWLSSKTTFVSLTPPSLVRPALRDGGRHQDGQDSKQSGIIILAVSRSNKK